MTAVFERILEMSAMAAVVIAVVLLIRLLLRKAPRKYSYALWSVAAFRLVCPVSFKAVFSIFRFGSGLGLERMNVPQTVSHIVSHTNDYDIAFPLIPPEMPSVTTTTPPTVGIISPSGDFVGYVEPTVAVSLVDRIIAIAAVIWLVGLAALLIYGIVSYVRLRRRMSTAVLLEGNVWQSDRVRSPFILGFARPKIYLPFGLSADQERYVLAHEKYHIKRFDHIVRPLSFLILAVHWFNPLVWVAYYMMSRDMEMSCDEKVLSTQDNIRKAYSITLLSFAANRRFPSPSPLAFGESGVKGRIKNALNWKKPRTWVTIIAVIVCIVVIIVCAANPKEPESCGDSMFRVLCDVTAEELNEAQISGASLESSQLTEAERIKLADLLRSVFRSELGEEDVPNVALGSGQLWISFPWGGLVLEDEQLYVGWIDSEGGSVNAVRFVTVDNAALKQFIRELPSEEEPAGPADPDPEPVLPDEELATWHADLTHDGVDEIIALLKNDSEVPYGYTVTVGNSDGTALWRGDASDWGGGHNGFYLYEKDGKSYLMEWCPSGHQGWYHFSYRIFSLNGTGEPGILAENMLQYDFGAYENRTDILTVDLDELRAFEAEVNKLLKDAIPLLVINNETTILGDPSNPVADQWTSPADEWEWYRQIRLEQQADRESRTLAVWPLNDLTLTVLETTEEGFYLIDVYGGGDYFFWDQIIDCWQGGVSYFCYEENGKQYLMELRDDSSQGVGMWSYRIFSVGPESTPVLRENSLYFQSTNVAEALAVDMADLQAFVNEVNGLLENVELIAEVSDGRFSYGTPGMNMVYSWNPPLLETIRESQTYWREKERELKKLIAEQCNTYYVRSLMQSDGQGYGQFTVLDQYLANKGTTAWVVFSFIETDRDGNFMAEYSNIPMMITCDIVDGEFVISEVWVEEKGQNLDARDELKNRFPPAAVQAVIDGTHAAELHMRITDSMDLPIGLTWTDGLTAAAEVLDAAYGYICKTHPDAQAAQINSMEEISTAAVGTTSGHLMYRLVYSVKLEDRWQLFKDGYLVLHRDWSSSSDYWYACGTVTQEEIDTIYSTEAMMKQYNDDPYLAAVIETVNLWRSNR